MKLRHATALALVGWYLMTPPLAENDSAWDTKAPLSQWHIMHSFDTAKACEDYVADLYVNALAKEPEKRQMFVRYAHCVASDDPRLKEK